MGVPYFETNPQDMPLLMLAACLGWRNVEVARRLLEQKADVARLIFGLPFHLGASFVFEGTPCLGGFKGKPKGESPIRRCPKKRCARLLEETHLLAKTSLF